MFLKRPELTVEVVDATTIKPFVAKALVTDSKSKSKTATAASDRLNFNKIPGNSLIFASVPYIVPVVLTLGGSTIIAHRA